jgi:hypothetical protein
MDRKALPGRGISRRLGVERQHSLAHLDKSWADIPCRWIEQGPWALLDFTLHVYEHTLLRSEVAKAQAYATYLRMLHRQRG